MSHRGGSERLADLAGLRRIEGLAVGWLVIGIVAFAVAGDRPKLVALTLAGVAGIVGFRGLQRVVSALGPDPPDEPDDAPEEPTDAAASQRETEEETDDPTDRPRRGGARALALAAGRLLILGAPVGAALLLGTESLPGLIAGYTVVPAALITEGLAEIVRALKGKEDRDVR